MCIKKKKQGWEKPPVELGSGPPLNPDFEGYADTEVICRQG